MFVAIGVHIGKDEARKCSAGNAPEDILKIAEQTIFAKNVAETLSQNGQIASLIEKACAGIWNTLKVEYGFSAALDNGWYLGIRTNEEEGSMDISVFSSLEHILGHVVSCTEQNVCLPKSDGTAPDAAAIIQAAVEDLFQKDYMEERPKIVAIF